MSKQVIFTSELVERTGQLGDVMASFLEEQVSEIQKRLENNYPGTEENTAWKITSTFSTLEGTKIPLTRLEVDERLDYPASMVDFTLDSLEKARILRLADNIYEVAHDTLALQISEKRSGDEKILLEIEKLINDRYLAYVSTGTLLSRKEIDYVSPYLSRLSLDEERQEFVDKSRKVARRRRLLLISLIVGAFLILATFTFIANNLRLEAQNQEKIAKQAEEEARKSAEEALKQKKLADENAKEAERQRIEAIKQKEEADAAKVAAEQSAEEALRQQAIAQQAQKEAEESAEEATRQKKAAEKSKNLAVKSAEEAKRQKLAAEQAKDAAVKSEKEAIAQRQKAKKLQISSLSSALASKSAKMKFNPRLKLLLARDSYSLLKATDTDVYKPEIYTGLFKAVEDGSGDGFDEFREYHKGAVRSIQVSNDFSKLFTTGSDGQLVQWNVKHNGAIGKPKAERKILRNKSNVEMVTTLSPNGDVLVLGGKTQSIEVIDLKNNTSSNFQTDKLIYDLDFLPDNKRFVALRGGTNITQYDVESKSATSIYNFSEPAQTISVHPNGKSVAIGGKRGLMKIIDLSTKKVIREYKATHPITVIKFDPSSNNLMMGLSNGELLMMRSNDEKYDGGINSRKLHGQQINDIDFSGGMMTAASNDGTVSLWLMKQFTVQLYEPFVFEDEKPWAMSCQFVDNDNQVAVGYRDGTIKFWTIDTDTLAGKLCDLIADKNYGELTDDEFQQYIDGIERSDYENYCNN